MIWKHLFRAMLLSLPLMFVYLVHFGIDSDSAPTGFIQADMPYYVANARQYLDGEHTGIWYANPYDADPDPPRVYFQPLIGLVGLLLYLAPGMPAIPFLVLGGIFTVAAFYLLSRLVEKILPQPSGRLHDLVLVSLAWGGGVLALLGALSSIASGQAIDPFRYDPERGLWFLNLGRNFIYPTEACYHFLVILLLLAVARRSKGWVLGLTWVLVVSHPYTGLQYALIVISWAILERQFVHSEELTWRDVGFFATPACFGFAYYLLWLPTFPSHRVLMEQWSLDWSIKAPTIVGAYGIVGMLALYRCRTLERAAACFRSPFNRFLLVSFFVSFVLANHEAFFSPRQPIHFTRGHIWLPLALLGFPVLAEFWQKWDHRPALRTLAAVVWCGVMLFDNTVFFADWYRQRPQGIYLSDSQRDVLAFLQADQASPIVLSENRRLSYLSAVYSSARPYLGHYFNTPNAPQKEAWLETFFAEGIIPPDLRGRDFWVLTEQHQDRLRSDQRCRELFDADGLHVFLFQQADASDL